MPGATLGLQAEDSTIAEAAQAAGLRHRPVRQEPPRRPERVPADRARLRRVLRQPLPPERRGGAGAAGLPEGPGVQGAVRSARRAQLQGDGQGRSDRGSALGQGRQADDRGHRAAHQEADGDDRRRDLGRRRSISSSGRHRPTSRSSAGSTSTRMHCRHACAAGDAGPERHAGNRVCRRHDRARRRRRQAAQDARRSRHRRQHHRHLHHRQRPAHELAGRMRP